MADPFGIIGVIGVAGQIIQCAVKLGLDWNDAPSDARSVVTEIQVLKTVLSETNTNILLNDDFKVAFHGHHSTILTQLSEEMQATSTSAMVLTCKRELGNLLEDLTKRSSGHRIGWERLKGAFIARRTRESIENLQRQCQTLNSLMAVDALTLGARIYREVIEAREEQQDWKEYISQEVILDWVTPLDYGPQQSDFIGRRQEGTGQWFLDSTQYLEWTGNEKQTLFCPGIPGAGKTILTSIVVDDLGKRFRDVENASVAYIYCNFRRQNDQKVEDLLASILKQLSQNQKSLPKCVETLFQEYKGGKRPSLNDISKALHTVVALSTRVFIVVDALDECQISDGSRAKFLEEIFSLQRISSTNIFATSRFIPDITEKFRQSLLLEIRADPDDIWRYVKNNILRLPSFVRGNTGLQKDIGAEIVRVVDGMFLLAQLHLDSLAGKRSPKAIRKALKQLYTGSGAYHLAYEDAMERIEGQLGDQEELAKQVLSWISCAKRPLSTTELQHALGVEVGEAELDLENIPHIEDIVSVCAGLVTVDAETGIIRLVHYTTQEYFRLTWKRWFPNAENNITNVCITYLSFRTFKNGPCNTDYELNARLNSYQFYEYAVCNWGHHVRKTEMASRDVIQFLQSEYHLAAHFQVWIVATHRQVGIWAFPRQMTGLHTAAFFNVPEAGKVLVSTDKGLNPKDGYGRTPLSWAAVNGHEAMVKLLLETGKVDVDHRADFDGRTPLFLAAKNGHYAIVQMLLETGRVDINTVEALECRTPISWASMNGHEAVVKMLLHTGKVDINSRDTSGRTPLSYAVKNGHEVVVKMLLNTGNIETRLNGRCSQTALSWAAENGYQVVVKMLLTSGRLDVNLRDDTGRTPLSRASENGHKTVVKMLLDSYWKAQGRLCK